METNSVFILIREAQQASHSAMIYGAWAIFFGIISFISSTWTLINCFKKGKNERNI